VIKCWSQYSDLQKCPINIGTNSTCKKIRGMGCYCIVEVQVTTASITISTDQIKWYISTTEIL